MYKDGLHLQVLKINNLSKVAYDNEMFSSIEKAKDYFVKKAGFNNYKEYCNYYKIEHVLERTKMKSKDSEFIRNAANALVKNSTKISDLELVFHDYSGGNEFHLLEDIIYSYTGDHTKEYPYDDLFKINNHEVRMFLNSLLDDLKSFEVSYYDYDEALISNNLQFLPSSIKPKYYDALISCLEEIYDKPFKIQYLKMHHIETRFLNKDEVEFEDLANGGIVKCNFYNEMRKKTFKLIEESSFHYDSKKNLISISFKINKNTNFYLTNGYLQKYK